jgi:bifunctional ADP-heptose synthase (sugar kinase/adenylyltransferase)
MNPFIPPLLYSGMNLNAVKDLKVMVVGDGIIDEYFYVRPIGKSIKENIISTVYEGEERFKGGVWAGANHIRDFCKTVDVMTGPELMINWRFVDKTYMHKLFTVHEKRAGSFDALDFKQYDLVIVTDFGHGAISKELIERVSNEAKYLAINAQTNSTNFGFNLVTKYKRADFIVIDELEARLAAHDRDSDIESVIGRLGFDNIIVTLGKNGAVGYDGKFHYSKAVTDNVIDTMGAGDAFLCVTAPFACAGFNMPDLLRIGNAAGAVKVGVVGHQSSVTREKLERYL